MSLKSSFFFRPTQHPRGAPQQLPPAEPQQQEPDEEILGSDDEEQEDPNDYCKGELHCCFSSNA